MITLYLVRHGETTYNAEGRIQGHSDAPLSDLGRQQATLVAKRLSRENFDGIWSSDLGRALATAEMVAEPHALPVQTTQLLREANLGILQGLTRQEIERKYPADQHEWRRNPLTMRPPGAETVEQLFDRGRQFVDEITRRYVGGVKLVVVGHGGSLRAVIGAALGLREETYRIFHFSNASLSIVEMGERSAAWLLNDTCHLDALKTDEETDQIGQ